MKRVLSRRGVPFAETTSGLVQPLLADNVELLASYSDWRRDWTQIVSGQFTNALYGSLLFYEQGTGHAELYDTDGQGGISLRDRYSWPSSWNLIIPGRFSEANFLPENRQHNDTGFPAKTGFVVYGQQAGYGALYAANGEGGFVRLAEYRDWRTTWTHIVAGMFTDSPYSGLLFYDQSSGYAEMYATDGGGGIDLIQSYSDWRTTWTQIVPGEFWDNGAVDCLLDQSCTPITDLFFYEGATGYGETYSNDGQGGLALVGAQWSFPPATIIVPGSFGGSAYTNLLFYNKQTSVFFPGTASAQELGLGSATSIVELNYADENLTNGIWSPSEIVTGWGDNWDAVVPGNFWMGDTEDLYFPDGGFTDLLFYERDRGLGQFYLHEPPDTPPDPLEGYASAHAVRPGETITFHIVSQVGPYKISIYRQGAQEVLMVADVPATPADPAPVPRMAYRDGAGWSPVASLRIPGDWPSGLYFARAYIPSSMIPPFGGTAFAQARRLQREVAPLDIPFVVRPTEPGRSARILLLIPDTTYEAYNFWGGRSLYGYVHDGAYEFSYPQAASFIPYAFRVSFLRPHNGVGIESSKWKFCEVPLIQWLDRQAIRVEICCASDLDDANALNFLSRYKLVVSVGHSEYWSDNMKHNVERFVSKGGNVAFLGANNCYWRVRFQDDPELGRSMTCYKQAAYDPNPEKTINWRDIPGDNDTKLTGVSYQWSEFPPLPEFQVLQPDHWVFANTGLGLYDRFGQYDENQTIIGPETDVTNSTKPPSFQQLATVYFDPLKHADQIASMGIMSAGGTVFAAGTINWSLGLSQDGGWNPVDQITRNLLIRLA